MRSKTNIGKKSMGRNNSERKAITALTVLVIVAVTAILPGCGNTLQSVEEPAVEDMQDKAVDVVLEKRVEADETQRKADNRLKDEVRETQQTSEKIQIRNEIQSDGNRTGQSDHGSDKTGIKEVPDGFELELTSEDWGLSFGEAGTQPGGNAKPEDLAWYDAYYVGDDSEKVIYLTFDCGYENGNTEPILDALEKHDVKATFFVVGHFLETAPELVKRMVEEGHTVGNHTYHHLDMPTISDRETFQKEMDDVADLFHEITGKELSAYYRPPQGKCNVDNLKIACELGYKTIFWSLAYVDWDQDNQPGHKEAFDKLTTRVHPGAIVLLHNTSSTNGEILDELLGRWEEMGYTFKPLSDLTEG